LASRDLQPGVDRDDGAFVDNVAFVLAVFDADGELLAERDIRRVGEDVRIAGTTGDQIVLVRSRMDGNCCGSLPGVQVSTMDPSTFLEEVVTDVDGLPGVSAVADDRMVLVDDGIGDRGGRPSCMVTALDLATRGVRDVGTLACIGVSGVAVSPDGHRAAVVIAQLGANEDELEHVVVIIDLRDGSILGNEAFAMAPNCMDGEATDSPTSGIPCLSPAEFRGVAWTSDHSVVLVIQDPNPNPDAVVIDGGLLLPGRLRAITIDVSPPQ
jgi:hypothetical protein